MTSAAITARATFWTHRPTTGDRLQALAPSRAEPGRVRPRSRFDRLDTEAGSRPAPEPRRTASA